MPSWWGKSLLPPSSKSLKTLNGLLPSQPSLGLYRGPSAPTRGAPWSPGVSPDWGMLGMTGTGPFYRRLRTPRALSLSPGRQLRSSDPDAPVHPVPARRGAWVHSGTVSAYCSSFSRDPGGAGATHPISQRSRSPERGWDSSRVLWVVVAKACPPKSLPDGRGSPSPSPPICCPSGIWILGLVTQSRVAWGLPPVPQFRNGHPLGRRGHRGSQRPCSRHGQR